MKLVSIQSPYAGYLALNITYALQALKDSLKRGEAPFASHILYQGILSDYLKKEREQGLECDYAFLAKCDLVAFYIDLGFSPGMVAAQEKAKELNIPTTMRHIGVT